jgi:transcriptional regulator with XRE-family HTH domain
MSLQLLADRAGLSKGFLSMVENGQRRLERRQHLAAVADALQVSVGDLTGQPYPPTDPGQGGAHALVPGVRLALMGSSLDGTDAVVSRPIQQLLQDTAEVMDLRQACEFDRVGRALIRLLPELHAAASCGPDREPALRSVVLVCQAATLWLKNLGYTDLAWIAADRGRRAALRLDDPLWVSAAEFARTQALAGLGAYGQMAALAARAAEDTPRTSQAGLEVYATQRLTQALAAAALGQDDAGAVAEAHAIARRTGQGTAFWIMFGPANVAQWEMSIALERGRPDRVVEVAETVDVAAIPVKSRRAAYCTDLGVALSMVKGRDGAAVTALRDAERLAPHRFRNSPVVRDVIGGLLRRSNHDRSGRDLRGLAYRVGLNH